MSVKDEFICKTCNLILSEPVQVPCSCGHTCKAHLDEQIANTQLNSLTCKHCHHTYDIPQSGGFRVDEKLKKVLEKEPYLSENQRKLKKAFGDSLKDLDFTCHEFATKFDKLTAMHQSHFSNLKRIVETRCTYLKQRVDIVAQEMLKKVESLHDEYKQSLLDQQLDMLHFDAESESRQLNEVFRDVTHQAWVIKIFL